MPKFLEKMDDFFTARVVGYDEHMLREVEGCENGYKKMAAELAARVKDGARLLDLGCGTGLELDEIWKLLPGVRVTGIDMTAAMLDVLRAKHPDKQMELICADYQTAEFGGPYDAAVSFQTMHHFLPDAKFAVYEKIYDALAPDAVYIECDYMCDTPEQEAYFQAELAKMKAEQGEGFYHYDIPCTVVHQLELLFKAGFNNLLRVFREGNTVMIVAIKKQKKPYGSAGLEEMDEFFANRIEGYDEHMVGRVKGLHRAYPIAAKALAAALGAGREVLDLGCGTGLELDALWAELPDVRATGIDMTAAMLDVLRAKHPDKQMTLRCESYFDADLGEAVFDGAISFESLHHFAPEKKLGLYKKLCAALKPGAVFIDGDKMSDTAEDEAEAFAAYREAVETFGLDPEKFYHFDTPLTPEHETALLLEAGFARVEQIFHEATVTVLAAYR